MEHMRRIDGEQGEFPSLLFGLASLCFDWTEQELEEEDALRLWL
jgi:hypothetical protein